MMILFAALGLTLWLLIGHIMLGRRYRRNIEQSAKLDAVTGYQEDNDDEDVYFHGSKRFVVAIYVAAFMQMLCWPYTAFIAKTDPWHFVLPW